jgi:IS4 transposase
VRHHNSLFHGLLKPIRWDLFEGSVEKHEADKGTRTLTAKSQLMALLQAQLSGLSSLREIVVTMESHRNRTYVFDLGYYDFSWWRKLLDHDCRFVTRLKKNTPTQVVAERALGADVIARGRVVQDRTVRLTTRLKGSRTHPLGGRDLREVNIVLDSGKPLRIISNDLTSTAEEIADLYKKRWTIELFFRWAKQTLKIKKFLGTSENAVRIQLTVALIAYLLLRIAHAAQTVVPGMLAFTQLVRANLMQPKMIHNLASSVPPPPRTTTAQLNLELSYG